MALPSIMRKLFRNDGYGPLLKDEIVDRHISIQDWSNTYDYSVNTLVRGSNGLLYWSVAQSGPNAGGAVNPTADDGTYWTSPSFKTLGVWDESNKTATTQWVWNLLRSRDVPRELYVDSVNGSDSNDGKTLATAYKTVEHAQEMLTASDYIYFTPPYAVVHLAMGSYGMLIGLPGCHVTYVCDSPYEGTKCTGVDAHQSGNVVYIKGKLTIDTGAMTAMNGGDIFLLDETMIVFQNQTTVCITSYNNSFIGNAEGDSVSFWFGNNVKASSATVNVGNCSVVYFQGNASFGGTVTLTGNGKSYRVAYSSVLRGIGSTTAIPPYTAGTVDSTSSFN